MKASPRMCLLLLLLARCLGAIPIAVHHGGNASLACRLDLPVWSGPGGISLPAPRRFPLDDGSLYFEDVQDGDAGRYLCKSQAPRGRKLHYTLEVFHPRRSGLCPEGTRARGPDICIACPPGYYRPSDQPPYCLPCDKGNYTPTYRSASCLSCPKGKSTLTLATQYLFDCIYLDAWNIKIRVPWKVDPYNFSIQWWIPILVLLLLFVIFISIPCMCLDVRRDLWLSFTSCCNYLKPEIEGLDKIKQLSKIESQGELLLSKEVKDTSSISETKSNISTGRGILKKAKELKKKILGEDTSKVGKYLSDLVYMKTKMHPESAKDRKKSIRYDFRSIKFEESEQKAIDPEDLVWSYEEESFFPASGKPQMKQFSDHPEFRKLGKALV